MPPHIASDRLSPLTSPPPKLEVAILILCNDGETCSRVFRIDIGGSGSASASVYVRWRCGSVSLLWSCWYIFLIACYDTFIKCLIISVCHPLFRVSYESHRTQSTMHARCMHDTKDALSHSQLCQSSRRVHLYTRIREKESPTNECIYFYIIQWRSDGFKWGRKTRTLPLATREIN